MKEKFETMLSGGHPNSLGNTLEVVDIILNDEESLDYLFECYSSNDATVRLRVSNAFKRIFRQKPNWLPPQPFLNLGIYTRLTYERIRARSDV